MPRALLCYYKKRITISITSVRGSPLGFAVLLARATSKLMEMCNEPNLYGISNRKQKEKTPRYCCFGKQRRTERKLSTIINNDASLDCFALFNVSRTHKSVCEWVERCEHTNTVEGLLKTWFIVCSVCCKNNVLSYVLIHSPFSYSAFKRSFSDKVVIFLMNASDILSPLR